MIAFIVLSITNKTPMTVISEIPSQSSERLSPTNDHLPEVDDRIVEVPNDLLQENTINSSDNLNAFLRQCQGKIVLFPSNAKFIFDGPIIINKLTDITIDFNNTTITYPDGYTGWDSLTIANSDVFIGNSLISVSDSDQIDIRRLILDGKKDAIDLLDLCVAIWIQDSSDVRMFDCEIKEINYHGIVIYDDTPGLLFDNLVLTNNFGSQNSSDVYISNSESSSADFIDITASRLKLEGNQVFYINGYNTTITGFKAYNCGTGLDYRKGTHTASDIYMENCNAVLYIQTTTLEEIADVTINNIQGINISPGTNTNTGLGIWSAGRVRLTDVVLEYSDDSDTALWGMIIRRFNDDYSIKDVVITNLTISGTTGSVIYYKNLDESVKINGLKILDYKNKLFRVEETTASQIVESLQLPENYFLILEDEIVDPDSKIEYSF